MTSRTKQLSVYGPSLLVALLAGAGCNPFERSDEPEPLFSERHRPAYHFTPARNWMNDPNGLVFYDGEYHLFFQHNPQGDRWGHLSWGHAVSKNLVDWQELPIAIAERDVMIFSGSAVVDWSNSSGFGTPDRPPLVAMYTGHHKQTNVQAQYLTYSLDRGRTWVEYGANPVIDIGSRDFRDPKIFFHAPSQHWILTLAHSVERRVAIYRSKDLRTWTEASRFGPAGAVAGVWECPELLELPLEGGGTKWALMVHINDGALAGGSGGQYFVGDFDGERFVPDRRPEVGQTSWIDYGTDFYASQSWSDLADERRIWIGWMANVKYAQDTPTHPWRGAMTIPRQLRLRLHDGRYRLVQTPVRELERLREPASAVALEKITVEHDSVPLENVARLGSAMEIHATLVPDKDAEASLEFTYGDQGALRIGYDARSGHMYVDRSRGVFAAHGFAGRHHAPVDLNDGGLSLRIYLDRSSVEVFAMNGERVITDLLFPSGNLTGVAALAASGTVQITDFRAWRLRTMHRCGADRDCTLGD